MTRKILRRCMRHRPPSVRVNKHIDSLNSQFTSQAGFELWSCCDIDTAAGASKEGGGWEFILGVDGSNNVSARLGRPVRIGLCAQYISTNVDSELTQAVRTAATTLTKATGGELVELEPPWTEEELEEVCTRKSSTFD